VYVLYNAIELFGLAISVVLYCSLRGVLAFLFFDLTPCSHLVVSVVDGDEPLLCYIYIMFLDTSGDDVTIDKCDDAQGIQLMAYTRELSP